MKIRQEHYEHIKQAIQAIDKEQLEAHKQAVKESGKYKDFATRILNDCLFHTVPASWVCDNLYPYMDDTHIASALRKINKELHIV